MSDIIKLVDQLKNPENELAYTASESLATIGTEEVVHAMIEILVDGHDDAKLLAAKTLSQMDTNEIALDPLLEAIDNNPHIASELITELEGFNLSSKYVTIFKYTLSKSFKISSIAQELLDYKEFDITPRVLKKAKKAWSHYENNVKHDELFDLKKQEVEEIFQSLEEFLDEQ